MKRPADLYDDLMKREGTSKFSREGIFGIANYIYDVYKRELTEDEMDDLLARSHEIIDRNYKEKLPHMNGYQNWNDFKEAFHVVGIPSWNWVLAIRMNEFEKQFDWDGFLYSKSGSLAKLKEESDKWKKEQKKMDIENLEHVGYIRFTSVGKDNQGVTILNFEWIIRDGHQTGYVMFRGGEILDRTLNCPADEHRIKSLPWVRNLSFKKFLDQVVVHPEIYINRAYIVQSSK